MVKTETIKIGEKTDPQTGEKTGGKTVMCTQFVATIAQKYLFTLLRIAGDPIAQAFKELEGVDLKNLNKIADEDVTMFLPMFGKAVALILANLDNPETSDLLVKLLEQTRVDGVEIKNEDAYNVVFSGDNLALIPEVLVFVIMHNFSGFFYAAVSKLAPLMEKVGVKKKKDGGDKTKTETKK